MIIIGTSSFLKEYWLGKKERPSNLKLKNNLQKCILCQLNITWFMVIAPHGLDFLLHSFTHFTPNRAETHLSSEENVAKNTN